MTEKKYTDLKIKLKDLILNVKLGKEKNKKKIKQLKKELARFLTKDSLSKVNK